MKAKIILLSKVLSFSFLLLTVNVNAQWQQTSLTNTYQVTAIAILGSNTFVGTEGNGVFLSQDSGTTWNATNNGLTNEYVTSLAASGSNIFAGTSSIGVWENELSDITTGIEKTNNNVDNIMVYPNPTANNLTIISPQNAVIEITNIQGQLIKTLTTTGNKTNINVSALPSGVYIVQVKTEKGVEVRKFVKE